MNSGQRLTTTRIANVFGKHENNKSARERDETGYNKEHVEELLVLCWSIYTRRNKVLFEGIEASPPEIYPLIIKHLIIL